MLGAIVAGKWADTVYDEGSLSIKKTLSVEF